MTRLEAIRAIKPIHSSSIRLMWFCYSCLLRNWRTLTNPTIRDGLGLTHAAATIAINGAIEHGILKPEGVIPGKQGKVRKIYSLSTKAVSLCQAFTQGKKK